MFKVITKGTTVEYTRNKRDAESAYKEAATPKQLWSVTSSGAVSLLASQAR